jgi:GAF domain-containing protein
MTTTQSLFELLRRFATTMARDFEVNDVLYELCDAAVVTLDAAGAGVSVAVGEGRLEFVTSTDHTVVTIEQAQERHQAGPCVEAFRSGEVVVVSDISQTTWPHYRAAAAQAGFESVVGLPLRLDDHRVGSLNVYDRRVREWSEADLAAARVLADVATAYLVRAGELAEARKLGEQLQHALDSRIVIEQAKGMLSRDHSISVDAAFELLRSHSRRTNTPLRQVAHAVVHDSLRLRNARSGA